MTIAGFDGRERETERKGIESQRRKPVETNVSLAFYSVKSLVRCGLDSRFARSRFAFSSFFFQSQLLTILQCTVHISTTQVGAVHYSWDLHTSLFNNFFIKNGSHDTIYIFKNYFVTVFSIFNFQQNKLYPNRPLVSVFGTNKLGWFGIKADSTIKAIDAMT